MNAVVDETSDQLAQNNIEGPEGPGARLRTARLASGLELDRVAAQLHLRPFQVEALEQDNYEGFPARVFVRGYLRNYARLVSLPADTVMAMFDAVHPDPDRPRQLRRVGTHRPQLSSGHGGMRIVSWALLLGIVALFLVWWTGYLKLDNIAVDNGSDVVAPSPTAGLSEQATQIAPELLMEGPNGSLPLPPATVDDESVSQDVDTNVEAGSAPVENGSTSSTETRLPSAESRAELAADVLTAPVSEPASPVQPEIVLKLSGLCWVQIRDSTNSYKLIGEFKAGTRRVLGGTPPYRILLGNAAAAELTVNGEIVDLAPHTNGQVARLTLDPSIQ